MTFRNRLVAVVERKALKVPKALRVLLVHKVPLVLLAHKVRKD